MTNERSAIGIIAQIDRTIRVVSKSPCAYAGVVRKINKQKRAVNQGLHVLCMSLLALISLHHSLDVYNF